MLENISAETPRSPPQAKEKHFSHWIQGKKCRRITWGT